MINYQLLRDKADINTIYTTEESSQDDQHSKCHQWLPPGTTTNQQASVHFHSTHIQSEHILAFLHPIWAQSDPVTERLALSSHNVQSVDKERLSSLTPGALFITRHAFIWVVAQETLCRNIQSSLTYGCFDLDNALVIPHTQIAYFYLQRIHIKSGVAPVTHSRTNAHLQIIQPSIAHLNESPSSSRLTPTPLTLGPKISRGTSSPQRDILRSTMTLSASVVSPKSGLKSKRSKQSTHVKQVPVMAIKFQPRGKHDEDLSPPTLSFHPLYEADVQQICSMLAQSHNLEPLAESLVVRHILATRLDSTRERCVLELMMKEQPYIERYNDLKNVISNLTVTSDPTSIYELERLLHSCRVESGVTKEAIDILRTYWRQSYRDPARLKILAVLDRLVNPAIIRPSDSNFDKIYHWLSTLVESINASRSPECMAAVNQMMDRMRWFKAVPIMHSPVNVAKMLPEQRILWTADARHTHELEHFQTQALWR